MRRMIVALVVMPFLAEPALLGDALVSRAEAHPGGLDAKGCHHDRKRGGYHCHRAQGSAASGTSGAAPLRARGKGSKGVRYRNCAEARAAGVAPIRRGEPGYSRHLDRDNDGIACE